MKIYYQKQLASKELKEYVEFLIKIKTLGDDFLVKGNMWLPSIKSNSNRPGIHIGRDPLLSEYHNQPDSICPIYTCSHLSQTLHDITEIKGKKTNILFELTEDELSIYVNDTQYVIASKYIPGTEDIYPEQNYFEDILGSVENWYEMGQEVLEDLLLGHPVKMKGVISGTNETTFIRLAKKVLKLRGMYRKIDYGGAFAIDKIRDGSFDDTICKLLLHMKYQKVECLNILFIRKY